MRRVLPWLAVAGAVAATAECPDPARGAPLERVLETNDLLPAMPVWSHQEIEGIINEAAADWGANAALLRRVAWRESKYDPRAYNRAGPYHGLFQFSYRTWEWMSARCGTWEFNPYEPWAAAYTAAWAFTHGQKHHWPTAY